MPRIDPEALRTAMDAEGVTVTSLAKSVDISLGYASDIVNGRRSVSRNPTLRRRIAHTIGVARRTIETDA